MTFDATDGRTSCRLGFAGLQVSAALDPSTDLNSEYIAAVQERQGRKSPRE